MDLAEVVFDQPLCKLRATVGLMGNRLCGRFTIKVYVVREQVNTACKVLEICKDTFERFSIEVLLCPGSIIPAVKIENEFDAAGNDRVLDGH
jgi:hypothetical protein